MSLGVSLGHYQRDLRYAARRLRQSPGFTLATAITLALGIGANTAMFSVVDSALLRALPYKNPDRLVVVWQTTPNNPQHMASEGNFLDWREQNSVFADLAAFAMGSLNLSGGGRAERVTSVRATWNAFPMLGRVPALGRGFQQDDDRPGAAPVVILTYGFWQRRFGGDPKAIGQTLQLNGRPFSVIGVMPRDFRFFYAPDLFAPLALDPASSSRDFEYLVAVGRLKPGISLAQAQEEMNRIARNLETAYPKTNQQSGVLLEPARQAVLEFVRVQAIWVLFGAVGFVLLIACVNVANLLLAQASARERELAVRASLGAGRARLLAQLLVESILLACMGGILGILFAVWLLRLVPNLVPDFARAGFAEIVIDWRVLGFTVALSMITGLFFGLFPAWRASRLDLQAMLKAGGRGSSGSLGQSRFRGALVVVQVALSLVLLASAGLMVRSLSAMESVYPGFRRDHILTMRLAMADNRFQPDELRVYYQRVLETADRVPGVESASLSLGIPLQGAQIAMPFRFASRAQSAQETFVPFELVSLDFFRTMGIALRQGRLFTQHDDAGAPRVAIVNDTFCRRYLAGEDPLGKQLLMQSLIAGSKNVGPAVPWNIVGVTATVKYGGLNERRPQPEVYVPLVQSPWPGAALVLRTHGEPLLLAPTLRVALAGVDPGVPLTAVKTMEQIAEDSIERSRLRTGLIGGFAGVALILAALGIYALISYLVAQSTHDLGIRMALGADAAAILWLVLTRGMLLTGLGLAVGIGGALVLTRFLSTLLYQIKPTDPWTLGAVSVLLALVALLAGLIPAVRAARIDPTAALRAE
jgi:predicted permease